MYTIPCLLFKTKHAWHDRIRIGILNRLLLYSVIRWYIHLNLVCKLHNFYIKGPVARNYVRQRVAVQKPYWSPQLPYLSAQEICWHSSSHPPCPLVILWRTFVLLDQVTSLWSVWIPDSNRWSRWWRRVGSRVAELILTWWITSVEVRFSTITTWHDHEEGVYFFPGKIYLLPLYSTNTYLKKKLHTLKDIYCQISRWYAFSLFILWTFRIFLFNPQLENVLLYTRE
jgi:hypothetical protein